MRKTELILNNNKSIQRFQAIMFLFFGMLNLWLVKA